MYIEIDIKGMKEFAIKYMNELKVIAEDKAKTFSTANLSISDQYISSSYSDYEIALNKYIDTRTLFFKLGLISWKERAFYYDDAERIIHIAHSHDNDCL